MEGGQGTWKMYAWEDKTAIICLAQKYKYTTYNGLMVGLVSEKHCQ